MAKVKKKYPDSVVYNEESKKFDANIKPYPTSVSAPSFKPIKVNKEDSIKANKYFESRMAEIKEEYNLKNNQIILSGFSQGCMMSINVGLTANKAFNCIVGFSGKIINSEDLKVRKKNSTNILLIHGNQDDVVSPTHLLEAKDFFLRENIDIETHLIKDCNHHIPVEASSIALNYILKNI